MKGKLLSVILLNVMLFFALVSIHEIVHVAVGLGLGCNYGKAVIMDTQAAGPYAEMACTNANQLLIYLGSLFATIAFGALFLYLKPAGSSIFFISLGLSLLFSSLDVGIAVLESLVYPMMAFGFAFVILGEYRIASACISDNLILEIFDLKD